MRIRPILVAILAVCFVLSVNVPISSAATGYEYILGFKTLHDLIPDVVGDCTSPLSYNSSNGDALQYSAKGMLVWRKADNWTAFTNGYRTWINGPNGIQARLNAERFSWETQTPTSQTCTLASDAILFATPTIQSDGTAVSQGTVKNTCSQTINVMIDMVGYASQNGQPLVDGPTVFVANLAPNATRSVIAKVPMAQSAHWFDWTYSAFVGQENCLSMETSECLNTDPWLDSAVSKLKKTQSGYWMLRVAAEHGISIRRDRIGAGTFGVYDRQTKSISLDQRLDNYSSWVRATVLAHELRHAVDDAAGQYPKTSSECYQAEERAFKQGSETWGTFWNNQLPANIDSVHQEFNAINLAITKDPVGFAASLVTLYGDECGQ